MKINVRALLNFALLGGVLLVAACVTPKATAEGVHSQLPAPGLLAASESAVAALKARVKQSMRLIKGGTFDMGDWGDENGRHYDMEDDSRPVHKVTLDTFSMMAYKVTYEDFDIFTSANQLELIDMGQGSRDVNGVLYRAPKRPAGVSWYGAKAYCQWLGKITKTTFDLPTEAQWEYAARSGGKKLIYATDNAKIDRGRNYPPEWEDGPKPPLPDVGSYPPNPIGLYGMAEEALEWTNDWYDKTYYQHPAEKNPKGPINGTKKSQRGKHGLNAEAFSLTFMRSAAAPQTLTLTYDKDGEVKKIPFPGYSGYRTDTFRCVSNLN
jgi:sulfatase modifying factor 1